MPETNNKPLLHLEKPLDFVNDNAVLNEYLLDDYDAIPDKSDYLDKLKDNPIAEITEYLGQLNADGLKLANELVHELTLRPEFRKAAGDNTEIEPTPPLPTVAPALWAERTTGRKVSPADFIRTHYGQWLGRGLLRSHIRTLDYQLYNAYAQWIKRNPNNKLDLPAREVRSYSDEDLRAVRSVTPVLTASQRKQRLLYQAAKQREYRNRLK